MPRVRCRCNRRDSSSYRTTGIFESPQVKVHDITELVRLLHGNYSFEDTECQEIFAVGKFLLFHKSAQLVKMNLRMFAACHVDTCKVA